MKKDTELSSELRHVAREGGTEAPFTGAYVHFNEKGVYTCAICGTSLFSSDTKFDSGSGWPSFTNPANTEHLILQKDHRFGIERTEVLCKTCGAHLGHLFMDGPPEAGGKRYCINSISLDFDKKEENHS
ncbi:MAG TPA: peptide-methionine (R)-S-oxide reductase MsrB [Candidatus Paceibacterota bacterium]|nr:peptide-methionine (R)-S-oxide reductase MsrB [Candidatus Paceibacterota bacterium]